MARFDEDRTADPITKTFERTFVKGTFDEDPSHEGDLSWLAIRMEDCSCA